MLTAFSFRDSFPIVVSALAAILTLRARSRVQYLEIGEYGLYVGSKREGKFFAWEDTAFLGVGPPDIMKDIEEQIASSAYIAELSDLARRRPKDSRNNAQAVIRFTRFHGNGRRMERLARVLFAPGVPANIPPAGMTTLLHELRWVSESGEETARALKFYHDNPEHRHELSSEANLVSFTARAKGYEPKDYDEDKIRRDERQKHQAMIKDLQEKRQKRLARSKK